MSIVVSNWITFFKKNKVLFIILMISQITAVVCIFFVFGIFQNNLYELSANTDSKRLQASLTGCQLDGNKLKDILVFMTEDAKAPIQYFFVEADSSDGKYTYQDRAQYKDGKITYSDSVFDIVKKSVEGKFASAEQYMQGAKVAVVPPNMGVGIGEHIKLEGEDFEIIGINKVNGDGEIEMPFTSFPKDCKWHRISIGLDLLPTREQYDFFKEKLSSYGAEVEEFYVANNEDIKRENSLMLVSVLLAFLAGGNMYMVYSYIFKRRKKQLAIYTICGCGRGLARGMFFMEILINMLIAVVAGVLLFRFAVYPVMVHYFVYLKTIYGIREYVAILFIYLTITLGMGWFLSVGMARKSIMEMRKEG